ncbi:hypothetical protein AAFF_G00411390 [Aldrovandia affinis]|uniref:Ras-related protein Rab n=1 Tax=Aldrovandia affinis TaxID=143900 RepID=A0AAD7SBS8_9TELE|nr:hypothetical protein AAFF_G00411390 [Aldrovandia affinis]
MLRVFYKGAVGAFIMFDLTRSCTFEAVSKWKQDLDCNVKLPDGCPIPTVLLANKCDQKNGDTIDISLLDRFCKEAGFLGWFHTSAKENVNVDTAGHFLVESILGNVREQQLEERESDVIKLDQTPAVAKSHAQCC